MGDYDIWKSTRTTKTGAFSPPVNVMELNTAGKDEPTWTSDNGCVMLISSDVSGHYEVFVVAKPTT
jgi:hypothetical protein